MRQPPPPVPATKRSSLRADCGRCFGLCCVAPGFSASADFAIDKAAGQPCPNLRQDFRCGIHDQLRQRGFPGCAAYDCFGAGQWVAQVTFGGRDWRRTPGVAAQMFAVFTVMRQLHELLWYLSEALTLQPARSLHGELRRALERTERLTRHDPGVLAELDVTAHRRRVNSLLARASALARESVLARASALARESVPRRQASLSGADLIGRDLRGANLKGADLIGKDLRGADLKGTDLKGACLIGANLAGADLRLADLLGADTRGAELSGADLSTTLFLTQGQAGAAKGDAATKLPPALDRPAHWLRGTLP